jgi:hypothetical protein
MAATRSLRWLDTNLRPLCRRFVVSRYQTTGPGTVTNQQLRVNMRSLSLAMMCVPDRRMQERPRVTFRRHATTFMPLMSAALSTTPANSVYSRYAGASKSVQMVLDNWSMHCTVALCFSRRCVYTFHLD